MYNKYSVEYINQWGGFGFSYYPDSIRAQSSYLALIWRGCRAVRLQCYIRDHWETMWETAVPVIRSIDNPF